MRINPNRSFEGRDQFHYFERIIHACVHCEAKAVGAILLGLGLGFRVKNDRIHPNVCSGLPLIVASHNYFFTTRAGNPDAYEIPAKTEGN